MADPKTVIIIPARHASQRFPGKALAPLAGATGLARSLIRRCWDAACAVPGVDAVWVATDDARIRDNAADAGAQVVMTDAACANGTERCADALARLGLAPDVVINLQGDAPLTPPHFVTALIDAIRSGAEVATPVLALDAAAAAALRAAQRAGRAEGVTAVIGAGGRALYFSREVLPHSAPGDGPCPVHVHVGVYAYTPQALADYVRKGCCALEIQEGLEQLRFLHHGLAVTCVPVEDRGYPIHEVNIPADIARVEAILRARAIA